MVSPRRLIIIGFLIFVIMGLWMRLMFMGGVLLQDWDEAIYAQVGREWLRHPSLTLTYNGQVWFEKPPLLFVLVGGFFWLIGTSEFAARLPATITACAVMLSILAIVKSRTSSRFLSILAVLLSFSTPFLIDRSNLVNVDIFLTLGWLVYLLPKQAFKWRLLGTLIGVGAKSLLGFFPLIIDGFLTMYERKLTRRWLAEAGVIILLALSWHFIMYFSYGQPFIQSHFLDHLVSRVLKPIELHDGNKFFYVMRIWDNYGPFLLLIIPALVALLRQSPIHKHILSRRSFPLLLAITYLGLLTISKSKLHWYVTPLLPLLGIIMVDGVSTFKERRWYRPLTIILLVLGMFLFGKQTYFATFDTSTPPSVQLARCKNQLPQMTHIAYYQDPQSRIDANVIEAAQLNIGSSFIYGGTPSFVFYVDRPVTFFYTLDALKRGISRADALVYDLRDKPDIEAEQLIEKLARLRGEVPLVECMAGNRTLVTHP